MNTKDDDDDDDVSVFNYSKNRGGELGRPIGSLKQHFASELLFIRKKNNEVALIGGRGRPQRR